MKKFIILLGVILFLFNGYTIYTTGCECVDNICSCPPEGFYKYIIICNFTIIAISFAFYYLNKRVDTVRKPTSHE